MRIAYSIDVDVCSNVLRHWPHVYMEYIIILHVHGCLGSRVCPNDLVQRQSYIYSIYTFVYTRGCDPYVHVQHGLRPPCATAVDCGTALAERSRRTMQRKVLCSACCGQRLIVRIHVCLGLYM